jgi:hypothetical protein
MTARPGELDYALPQEPARLRNAQRATGFQGPQARPID